ncbi:MAG: hypothetical protein PHE68_02750 [Candidatus Peribacteraceae bacterium]|nr:hypothetical protein [Candidatus Peribacteraceae bacterium]MDD5074651.1 hypothetical protein [Candidatus Peribacteraceae bacterium]
MSEKRDGLGIPDDPRFLLPKDRGEITDATQDGPLPVGEFGWPAGKAGRIARARAMIRRVCAEGTGE